MIYDLTFIGDTVRIERKRRGVTQKELATLSGVSRATINALENYKAKDVSVNTLSSILNALVSPVIATTQSPEEVKSQPAFDFPYVWSNQHPSDELLITKVLERSLFQDILTLCLHYGALKVNSVLYSSTLKEDEFLMKSLTRMLSNIQKGIARA